MFQWIPNAYIKYPCTQEGLRAAQMSVPKRIRVNMTCASRRSRPLPCMPQQRDQMSRCIYPRLLAGLTITGEDGMDLVKNIKEMYEPGDGHVHVLAASIRNVNHLLCSFALGAELVTVPTKVLGEWAAKGFSMPGHDFRYKGVDASGQL